MHIQPIRLTASILAALIISGCSEKPLAEEALAVVATRTYDPQDAQFRNIVLRDKWTICGELNGKTPRGEYTGFLKFYANKSDGGWTVFIDHEGSDVAESKCQ
jgi:hypothetical protein